MAYAPIRRRCPVCQEIKVYKDPRAVVCSTECESERRLSMGFFDRFQKAGNDSVKRATAQRLATTLRQMGASEEIISTSVRARDRAYSAGHMRGKSFGYQKGWEAARAAAAAHAQGWTA